MVLRRRNYTTCNTKVCTIYKLQQSLFLFSYKDKFSSNKTLKRFKKRHKLDEISLYIKNIKNYNLFFEALAFFFLIFLIRKVLFNNAVKRVKHSLDVIRIPASRFYLFLFYQKGIWRSFVVLRKLGFGVRCKDAKSLFSFARVPFFN